MTAAPRQLVGAAARYTTPRSPSATNHTTIDSSWQAAAWDYYSSTPEVRFAANWIGNGMSLGRLVAARRLPNGTIQPAQPDTRHRAVELVSSIAGGPDGQADLLRDFGPHLVVAGEGWIVIREEGRNKVPSWRVLSVLEVTAQAGSTTMQIEIDGKRETYRVDADDAPVVIRVWDPHPRRHLEPDSPVRAALGLLEELRLLNASVKAIARSRLTGRGLLLIPQGARLPTPPGHEAAEDDLIDVLFTVASTAISDPESPAATIPLVLEVPSDQIPDIKLVSFASDFDDLAIKLRDEAIRRFASGMEMPAEVILGLADTNHWSAWAVQEEAIRLGVEPRLAMVCHALTTQWLRPALQTENVPDADDWLVWYDTSALRVRTNRAQTALEVYAKGAISAQALRRETGFDESDAPDTTTKPDTPDLDRPNRPQEELPVDETTGPPTQPTSPPNPTTAALVAAADGLVWAALQRAGEKLRRTPACPRTRRADANRITAADMHTLLPVTPAQIDQWGLLTDVWDRTDEIAARYGADPGCLRASLDTYCRELLAAGVRHDYTHVPAALADCLDLAA